ASVAGHPLMAQLSAKAKSAETRIVCRSVYFTVNAALGAAPNISGLYMASTRVGGRLNCPALFSLTVYSTLHFPFGTNSKYERNASKLRSSNAGHTQPVRFSPLLLICESRPRPPPSTLALAGIGSSTTTQVISDCAS